MNVGRVERELTNRQPVRRMDGLLFPSSSSNYLVVVVFVLLVGLLWGGIAFCCMKVCVCGFVDFIRANCKGDSRREVENARVINKPLGPSLTFWGNWIDW